MNIKIDEEEHLILKEMCVMDYQIGSKLYGTSTEESDTDILMVIDQNNWEKYASDSVDFRSLSLCKYLPNLHPFQYDCEKTNTDYIYATERQFTRSLVTGDSTVFAEALMWGFGYGLQPVEYFRTYKILKGFNGYSKRDISKIKEHPSTEKFRQHAIRGLYIQQELLNNRLPDLGGWINHKFQELGKHELSDLQKDFRKIMNKMVESGDLYDYYVPKSTVSLVGKHLKANNTREFKYP